MNHEPAHPTRRSFFALCTSAAVCVLASQAPTASAAAGELDLTEVEWRRRLSPAAYGVLRQSATEHPFSSPLNNEHRRGTFVCAGCDLPLFSSVTKFDSGTGWPSFYDHLPDAVRGSPDRSFGEQREEVHCTRCRGHLGHVFNDGPRPTGLRYCMNGVAMRFVPR